MSRAAQTNLQQQNAMARAMMTATAPVINKILQTATASVGGVMRVKLDNTGITTGLTLDVSCGVTIGVATAVPSTRAPWNLINRIKVTDPDQTDRVSLSGFQLFILNCVRSRAYYGFNNGAPTAVFANPVVPTAVGNGTIQFLIDIPIAYDADNPVRELRDYRGALLQQIALGEAYLTIEWNSTLYANANVNAVYAGAATTTVAPNPATNNITCLVSQVGLFPQPLNGAQPPLPSLDLLTVYELNGGLNTSDNIVVNQEKYLQIPPQRSVIGMYVNYIQGGVQAAGAISRFRAIVNSNNPLTDRTERLQLFEQRKHLLVDADTVAGSYFHLFRERPIETALVGNMQWGVTPSTVGANATMELLVESFYTKGQMLPGVLTT
jgi:hypothetical protein